MKHFLNTNPLLIGIAALIAVVYAGGRAMLGRHEGVVAKGHAVQTAGLVRAARDAAQDATDANRARSESGSALTPLDRQAASDTSGIWVHGHLSCDGLGYAGALAFRSSLANGEGFGSEDSLGRVTRTKDDGFFELVLESGGSYEVRFEPDPDATGSVGTPQAIVFGVELPGDPGDPNDPKATEHALELALPSGRVEGRILTPDDQPVGDALLSLYSGPGEDDAPAGTPIATSDTDADGRFAFALLSPGTYRVFARSRNGRQFARETIEVDDEGTAQAVTLRWAY